MDNQLEQFLSPTHVIDSDHPNIVRKARELTAGLNNDIDKAVSPFYFVRDNIRYNLYVSKYSPDNFKASNTLASGEGYCVQKAILLDAFARALGIPAALGFARLINHLLPEKTTKWLRGYVLPFHGYSELYLNHRWVKATPSFDSGLNEKFGFLPIEFDGARDAYYPSHNREGKPHIEYIHHYGRLFPDLPFEQLQENILRICGPQMLDPKGELG